MRNLQNSRIIRATISRGTHQQAIVGAQAWYRASLQKDIQTNLCVSNPVGSSQLLAQLPQCGHDLCEPLSACLCAFHSRLLFSLPPIFCLPLLFFVFAPTATYFTSLRLNTARHVNSTHSCFIQWVQRNVLSSCGAIGDFTPVRFNHHLPCSRRVKRTRSAQTESNWFCDFYTAISSGCENSSDFSQLNTISTSKGVHRNTNRLTLVCNGVRFQPLKYYHYNTVKKIQLNRAANFLARFFVSLCLFQVSSVIIRHAQPH